MRSCTSARKAFELFFPGQRNQGAMTIPEFRLAEGSLAFGAGGSQQRSAARVHAEARSKPLRRRCWVTRALTLSAVFTVAVASAAAAEPSPFEQWLPNMRRAWADYRELFASWQGSLSGTISSRAKRTSPKELPLWDWEVRLITDGPRVRVEVERQVYSRPDGSPKDRGREVLCVNGSYAFRLIPAPPSWGKNQFLVSRLERPPADEVRFRLKGVLESLRWASLVNLPMVDLATLFARPDFRVISAGWEGNRVTVDFELRQKADELWGLRSGTVVLDPEHYWCLRYAETQVWLEGGWVKTVIVFEPVAGGPEGFLVSRRTEQDYFAEHYGGFESYDFELKPNKGKVDEEVFSLSAFGIEEPTFEAPGQAGRLWLLAINAILLLVVGSLLVWRSSCSRQKAPQSLSAPDAHAPRTRGETTCPREDGDGM